jgi:head-tail adaptor
MCPEYTIHIPDALQTDYQLLLKAKAAALTKRVKVEELWAAAKALHAADQKAATAEMSAANRRIGALLARAQAVPPAE